jgi:hypothetical protein
MKFLTTRLNAFCCSCAFITAASLLLDCSPTRIVGNGSGTSSFTGTVLSSDGKPVEGALVSIYKTDDTPSPSLKKQASVDSIFTDFDGSFSVEAKPNIIYNVIAETGNFKCIKDSVVILDTTNTTDIGTMLLEPVGSLKGRVTLSAGHDPRTVLILVYGTNTFTVPEGSDGIFSLKSMAAGRYAVRFMSTIAGYEALDTILTINAGASDTLGATIRLDYAGVQRVSIAQASWDSLLLQGVLKWHPVDTTQASIKGYNVYRGSAHNPLTLVASAIADTFFQCDSLYFSADSFFYFRINAVLSTGDEGKAGLCTMNVSPRAWKGKEKTNWPGFSNDYYVRYMEAGFNRLFMVNQQTIGVLRFTGQPVSFPTIIRRPEFVNIKGIAVSNSGFYVANTAMTSPEDSGVIEIYAFDSAGAFLGKRFDAKMSGPECGLVKSIKVFNDDNFYFLSDTRIERRNSSGTILNTLMPPSGLNAINTTYASLTDRILYFHSTRYLIQWQLDIVSPDCVVEKNVSLSQAKTDGFVADRGNNTFFSIEKYPSEAGRGARYFLLEKTLNGGLVSRMMMDAEDDLGIMFCCDEKGGLFIRDVTEGVITRYER